MPAQPVLYSSTNRAVPPTALADALLQGQAADRGLFMPLAIPPFAPGELRALAGAAYVDVAHAVLRRFTLGTFDDTRLRALCEDAYDYDVPLERVDGRRHVMRLDRGPTASFKDFAARMMARWMGVLMEHDDSELVILTATSGDTGSAVAHAYHGVPRVKVVVLFPVAEVSDRQRRQMTTLGGNVATFAVDGKFDDCQALVKRAFADAALRGIRLTSANSINIGRLLPQSVYYVYAYARLADVNAEEPVVFSVPSGNFGDMMGGIIAWRMGLPFRRMVVATNENDEFPRYVASGSYRKIAPSRVCISNAMNVGHPSNLARLVEAYGGWMDETGEIREPADIERLRGDIYAVSVSDEETRAAIRDAWQRHHLLLEPHGAVGWAGLERYLADEPAARDVLSLSIETAHPAKFPEEIHALVGIDPELPPSLRGLDERVEHYERLAHDYDAFCRLLLERYA
ncbi:MAG: threonine synthase [Acidobacteria bacterium]|nr:threonine synthase [Acidobacteriota bacterium]